MPRQPIQPPFALRRRHRRAGDHRLRRRALAGRGRRRRHSRSRHRRAGLRRHPDRGDRRRLFLGRAGRVPAYRGRGQRGVRLCRRQQERPPTTARSSTGTTGHAESVEIKYDPKKISYGKILQIFFSVAHDPTQLNRQGPDSGTQYRSAIFTTNDEQKKVADAYIAQLNAAKVYRKPIVTKVGPLEGFYPAEAYHQDYLTLHPNQPYIAYNDIPKVENLKKMFAQDYTEKPTLVSKPRSPTDGWSSERRSHVRHQDDARQGREERGRMAHAN